MAFAQGWKLKEGKRLSHEDVLKEEKSYRPNDFSMRKKIKKEDIAKVFMQGKSLCFKEICVRFLKKNTEQTNFAFICGKKNIPLAVTRNTIKRHLRESVQLLKGRIVPGIDIVILFRGKSPLLAQPLYQRVEETFKKSHLLLK